MVNEHGRKRLPPYVSYRTFRNFVDGLQQRMPARIDRSYWGELLSGSSGAQLMSALRFLDLIDDHGRPTDSLRPLVAAKGDQRSIVLKDIAAQSFDFVLQGTLDPQNATYSQLEEIFSDRFPLSGDLSRKCLKFFIELASDAGIPLSPFITRRFRSAHTTPGTKTSPKKTNTRTSSKPPAGRTNRELAIPQGIEDMPSLNSWDRVLLTKFPTFDPNWSDDVKLKWFSAFDELMKRILSRGEK
jgi:hypothetical protein